MCTESSKPTMVQHANKLTMVQYALPLVSTLVLQQLRSMDVHIAQKIYMQLASVKQSERQHSRSTPEEAAKIISEDCSARSGHRAGPPHSSQLAYVCNRNF